MKYQAITNCRVSSDEQLKNNSLSRQQASVLSAAKRLDVEIPKDGQWSGSVSSKRGNNYNRKDIREMLEYCKKHPRVKYLIVDEPDRFMRSIDEAFYWEVEFKERAGVKVWYACDDELNSDNIAAKLMRFTKYLSAEGSNLERQTKSISGDVKAIEEGRYPFAPKLGYMRGVKAGIYIFKPEVGELMKDILQKLASGILGLSESLEEFNSSNYVKSEKHCPYKLDKWRLIVSDPYYAGIIEINKQVKARNENGLHEAMITKEQHQKIIDIVQTKKKNQTGPAKNGNPTFPLNTITLCKSCYEKETQDGRIGRHNRGKFVGFRYCNSRKKKYYYRYRCRVCGRSILRNELHEEMRIFLNQFDFTEQGRKPLEKALNRVWKLEGSQRSSDILSLKKQITALKREKDALVDKISSVTSQTVSQEIEKRIEVKANEISNLEGKLEDIKASSDSKKEEFMHFAFDFVDNLANHFFELTPNETKELKLLLFPDGFFVNEENKVLTTRISPFYRLRDNKKDTQSVDFDNLVRAKRL